MRRASPPGAPGNDEGRRANGAPRVDTATDTLNCAEAAPCGKGIDPDLVLRARRLAAIPEDEFERELALWRQRVRDENRRLRVRLMRAAERAGSQQ